MARDPRPADPQTLDPSAVLSLAVRQFNAWRFWDCHETLEDLWRAEESSLADFYQGLIKLAAGFHHLLRGNHKGAVNLLGGALQLLEPFRPRCLSIDVDALLAGAHACREQVLALGPHGLRQFDRSLIPTIARPQPPAEAGPPPVDVEGPTASAPPQDGFVQANGLRLHYLDWGGDGPAAVLLHGSSFLARIWEPIAQDLRQDFRVLAFDARGHGDSAKPATGYGWDLFTRDLIASLDALSLRGVLAVGHSGGAAAIAYAAAQRPDLFHRIVLIEPIIAALEEPNESADLIAAARRRRSVWSGRDELFRAYRDRPPFDTWRQDILRLYVDQGTFDRPNGQVELKCPPEIETQVYEGRRAIDVFAALPRVRCPALVLYGQQSQGFPARAAQAASTHIPDARLVAIAGATHFVPMEQPEAIVAAVRAFLQE